MRLVLELGSHPSRYLTPAIGVIESIQRQLPQVEIAVHLLDDEKGQGNATSTVRQRLSQYVADTHIYVTPYPLSSAQASSASALDTSTIQQQIKNRLVARVGDYALEPIKPDAVLRFAPQDAQTLGVFTDGQQPLTHFSSLTLDPESQSAEAAQTAVLAWLTAISTWGNWRD